MKTAEDLRQLFKNRSNCYADAEDVVQAMDEDCFIATVKEALQSLIKEFEGRVKQHEDNYEASMLYHGVHRGMKKEAEFIIERLKELTENNVNKK